MLAPIAVSLWTHLYFWHKRAALNLVPLVLHSTLKLWSQGRTAWLATIALFPTEMTVCQVVCSVEKSWLRNRPHRLNSGYFVSDELRISAKPSGWGFSWWEYITFIPGPQCPRPNMANMANIAQIGKIFIIFSYGSYSYYTYYTSIKLWINWTVKSVEKAWSGTKHFYVFFYHNEPTQVGIYFNKAIIRNQNAIENIFYTRYRITNNIYYSLLRLRNTFFLTIWYLFW